MARNLHLTWSDECVDKCPLCGGPTKLIVNSNAWHTDYESDPYESEVHTAEELTGHYCQKCARLCSLSLNAE